MKLCPKCQKQFSDDANFCPVDAARLAPIDVQAGGGDTLAVRFDLGPRLGGGRTGAVHRATDKTTGQAVVVKLVAPAVVALPGVAQRLERELRQLERVHSPGVAQVLASGKRNQDETWVAVELLEGAHTLADAITARGPIAPDQAADLIEVVGEALIEAAQVGVVHRDLAPKNVLFAGQDVKLINFSLPVPTTDKVPGVPEFVAPEQVDGRPVDQRSNLYSLGALYYYVLTGHPVFAGTAEDVHRQHQGGVIRPPSQLIATIAAGSPVEALILRALDRSPTKRFLTVRQLVDEVARIGHGEVIELKAAPVLRHRPKAELVSTLMGVRGGAPPIVAAPIVAPPVAAAVAPPPNIASAPTVGTGVPSVELRGTMVGLASGAAPAPVAPAPVAPALPAPAPAIQAPLMQAAAVASPLQAPMAGSPWAPPAQAAVVAAPVVAAPVVAAPSVNAQPAGKQKAAEPADKKGKFRETMWFKKGYLDAQAAVAAAEERARTGKEAGGDKADSLPMDERYKDDGSISRGDKEKYSLRTGATQMMAALRPEGAGTSMKVSEDALIGEMKGGRSKVLIAIALAVIAIVVLIVLVAR
ncbi:MAG: serine/threonine-protein kinase [Kofleriaceae bacterium]